MANGGENHLEPFLDRPYKVENSLLEPNFGGDALNCTLLHVVGQPASSLELPANWPVTSRAGLTLGANERKLSKEAGWRPNSPVIAMAM